MSRPKKEIDGDLVQKLAEIQCTGREMAAICECDEKTLRNRFSAEIAKGREVGKMALRRKQWATAQQGNVAMLIWLGKQWLGQSDKSQVEMTEVQPVAAADMERYRETIRKETGYLDYLRGHSEGNGDTGLVGQSGDSGMGAGRAPGNGRPGANGTGRSDQPG